MVSSFFIKLLQFLSLSALTLCRRFWLFRHFLVPAALALPNREDGIWIAAALVNGAIRGDDFSATTRTRATSRRSPFHINCESDIFRHSRYQLSPEPRRLRIINIEQKIVTGGTSKTSTPIFRFLMKPALLAPAKEARHMEHCAEAVS
jgi:hypothetical protein